MSLHYNPEHISNYRIENQFSPLLVELEEKFQDKGSDGEMEIEEPPPTVPYPFMGD